MSDALVPMTEVNAFSIAMQAQSYLRAFAVMAAERVRLRKILQAAPQSQADLNAYSQLGNPSVVCLAFAAELALKALLKDANVGFSRKAGAGHSLLLLASRLPVATNARLLAQLRCTQDELGQYLAMVDKNFEEWRYSYEHEFLQCNPDFLEQLAHFAIDEFYVQDGWGKVPKVGNW